MSITKKQDVKAGIFVFSGFMVNYSLIWFSKREIRAI